MTHFLKYCNNLVLSLAATMIMIPNMLQANSNGTAHNGNGDRTGSPISSGTCANCHSGGSFGAVETIISVVDLSGAPVISFVAGETYMITVEVTNTTGTPSAFGFQLSLLDSENNFIGIFSMPSTESGVYNQFNQYFWENTASSTSNTFSVLWDAPALMTTVNIYAASVAVNGTGGTAGDQPSIGASFSAELALPAEWIFANGFE